MATGISSFLSLQKSDISVKRCTFSVEGAARNFTVLVEFKTHIPCAKIRIANLIFVFLIFVAFLKKTVIIDLGGVIHE